MTNYKLRFNSALDNTSKLIDSPINHICSQTNSLLDQEVDKDIILFLSKFQPIQAVSRCFDIHLRLKSHLGNKYNFNIFLTFGYVDTGHNKWYEFGINEIKSWINNPNPKNKKQFHCWLTLPTMEIIDISFPSTILAHNNEAVDKWMIVEDYADNLDSWVYHPVFVGEELALKMGLIGITIL